VTCEVMENRRRRARKRTKMAKPEIREVASVFNDI